MRTWRWRRCRPWRPHLRSGKVKALAVGGAKRLSIMPDLPTVAKPGCRATRPSIWWAWAATGGHAGGHFNKLNTEVGGRYSSCPETTKRFAAEGAEVEIRTPAEIREMIKADLVKWEKVAQDAKMPKQ